MSDTELVKKAKRHAESCDNETGSFLSHHLIKIRCNSFIQGYKEGHHVSSVVANRKAREIKKLKAENKRFKVAIEWARDSYHLPQDVLDIFREIAPEPIEFSEMDFFKSVYGEGY